MGSVTQDARAGVVDAFEDGDDWKWTLIFDNTNPCFPVELFIQLMERDAVYNGFNSERTCAYTLRHFSDKEFISENPKRHDNPLTLSWQKAYLKANTCKNLNWNVMKADLLRCFGRKVDCSFDDKLMLLNSLTKGRKENGVHFLIRVKFVVNIIEYGRWEEQPMTTMTSQWTKIIFLSGLSPEEDALICARKDVENETVLAEILNEFKTHSDQDPHDDSFFEKEEEEEAKDGDNENHIKVENHRETEDEDVKFEELLREEESSDSVDYDDDTDDDPLVKEKRRKKFKKKKKELVPDDDDKKKKKNLECDRCDLTFKTKSKLRAHVRAKHVDPSVCQICNASFLKRVELSRHCNQMHNGRRAKCPECGKQLHDEDVLKNHLKIVHDPDKTNRPIPPQLVTTSRSIVRENTRDAGGESQSPLKHLITQIIRIKYSKSVYVCAICKQRITGRTEFTLHARLKHGGHVARCDACDYTTKSLHSLSRHRLGVHGVVTDGFKIYHCDREGCEYRSTDRQKVPHHIASVHDNVRPHECQTCRRTFGSKGGLKVHVEQVHMGVRRFSCDVCGDTFKTLCHFKEHKAMRHGPTPPVRHMCDECGGSFSKLNTLHKHIRRVHRLEKTVECPHCPGKRFFSGTRLMFHLRSVHQLDKKYPCPQCGKGFRNNSELRKHIGVFHLKIKAFRCRLCNSYFTKGCNLCYHIGTNHMGMTTAESREKTRLAKAHEAYEHTNVHNKEIEDIMAMNRCHRPSAAETSTRPLPPPEESTESSLPVANQEEA